jgi:Asp-tRNA(Asn)/Glu-tRNA(Gln) amidotransferase A subunit family amidase
MQDYDRYDALGLAELVRSRQVSPAELLDAALNRTAALNPAINAIVYLREAGAREDISRGLPEGPFTGVPFLLKDLYANFTGLPVSNGSPFWKDTVPDHDSELVARYRQAGLAVFGRTTSPELGLTATTESRPWGETHNPWKRGYTSGGSSGGASAAVAAGIVPAAHASDGGGSIRIPASCCGLFGLKPTRGRTPAGPDAGEGWGGMSAQHVVSRSVRDSAALLDATAGPDTGAPYFAPPPARPFLDEVGAPTGKLRIGFQSRSFNGTETHPDCVTALEAAAALCRDLGHELEEVDLDFDRERLAQATMPIIAANIHAAIEDRAKELGRAPFEHELCTGTMRIAALGARTTAEEYVRGIRTIHAVGRQVGRFFERYDILLTPTMATPPLPHGRLSLDREDDGYVGDITRAVAFTSLFNATGNPSMSVPLHWNAQELPIGTMFTAAYANEALLFRLAAQLEGARPWASRRPEVLATA